MGHCGRQCTCRCSARAPSHERLRPAIVAEVEAAHAFHVVATILPIDECPAVRAELQLAILNTILDHLPSLPVGGLRFLVRLALSIEALSPLFVGFPPCNSPNIILQVQLVHLIHVEVRQERRELKSIGTSRLRKKNNSRTSGGTCWHTTWSGKGSEGQGSSTVPMQHRMRPWRPMISCRASLVAEVRTLSVKH